MNTIEQLPVSRLLPHPDNPRKDLGDLTELTESVRENGILQNLTVVPAIMVEHITVPDDSKQYYVVIIGHRRHAAATAAGLETVPCVITNMDRKTQLTTMMMENVQRCDLTPYEQAQGFHQLALLGLNVAEISRRSGFSKKVVKSRLEMAQLDQKLLKEVATGRQISMMDFEKLTEIKDLKARNEVLRAIGTNNFNQKLEEAKVRQQAAEKLPAVKNWLQEHGAQRIESKDAHSGRYLSGFGQHGKYFGWISIANIDTEKFSQLPYEKDIKKRDLFYTLDNDKTHLSLYVKDDSRGPRVGEKKTEEEKAKDRTMREVRAKIRELTALHYGLRKSFIEGLTVTKSNRDKIVAGALLPAVYFAATYGGHQSESMNAALGLEKNEYHQHKIRDAIDALDDKNLARAVYAIYNDSAENWFAADMLTPFTIPHFDKGSVPVLLHFLYPWLISLGYEPSTEEQALRDGSHEIYKKAKKGAKS